VTYAVASYIYRWFVTFAIVWFLSQVLKPYKLESISYLLGAAALVPLLGTPVYQIVKFLRTPGRLRKVKKVRATAFAVAAIVLVTGILLIPTPLRVQGTFVLRPAKPEVIYAEVEGRLVELNVKNGQWVTKDTVLAKLSNPQKQKELLEKQLEQAVNWHKYLYFNRSAERENRAQAMRHKEIADKTEPIIQNITEQIGKLTLVAGRDGQVIGAPHHSTLGAWLKPGKPSDTETRSDKPFFCEIGDPHRLEADLIMDQSDINLLQVDNVAWLKISGKAEKTYKSQVAEIAPRASDQVPSELTNLAEGEVAASQDPKTGAIKPKNAVYEIKILVDNANLDLEPGLRGIAKIDGGTYTLGWWLWRTFKKVFNFQL
jgi:putative peptide zinc metalloprotease protein